MALITCPDCGQSVSDRAEVCIHCGAPLKSKPLEPVYISFPEVSTFVGKGTVYYNGTSESCGIGGTIRLTITKPTEIAVKVGGYFGKPTLTVKPGDKVSVSISPLGKVSLSFVSSVNGNNRSNFW